MIKIESSIKSTKKERLLDRKNLIFVYMIILFKIELSQKVRNEWTRTLNCIGTKNFKYSLWLPTPIPHLFIKRVFRLFLKNLSLECWVFVRMLSQFWNTFLLNDLSDMVKFVMCTLVCYLQKGTQSLEIRVHMTNLTRSI